MGVSAEPRIEGLGAILNEVRKELLDFGLRNPLLNYRLLKSRGLEVVDERPPDVYRLLVLEGKRFSFCRWRIGAKPGWRSPLRQKKQHLTM